MCNPRQLNGIVALALLLLWGGVDLIQREPASAQGVEGVQVQTRGPVHEAFAELVATEPQPGIVVPKAPPPPIEELPPEEAPAGDNVVWIPGYWGWDEEREDFFWVSGIWRVTPPDCSWVPGYWSEVDGGFQWVAGYWLPNEVEEVDYLPPPPVSIEEGPSSDPPSPDSIWLNGCWIWSEDRYVWRSGYWVEGRPDWVYVSPHYIWTPRGCVFVEGYWDHPLAHRGVLFAPVYFTRPVYAEPTYRYSPSVFIDVTLLASQLFRHPRYDHYVFGDYYEDRYTHLGIVPWFEPCYGRHGYDPVFAQERWARRRHDPEWMEHLRNDHESRRRRPEARPPKVFEPQPATQAPPGGGQNLLIGKRLQDVGNEKDSPLNLVKIDREKREHFSQARRDLQRFTEERVKLEVAPPGPAAPPGQEPRGKKVAIPKSPIRSKAVPMKAGADAPPAPLQVPKPDPPSKSLQPRPPKETARPPRNLLSVPSPKPLPESKRPVPKQEAAGLESRARNLGIPDVPKPPTTGPSGLKSKQLQQIPPPNTKRLRSGPGPDKATLAPPKTGPKLNRGQNPPLSLRPPASPQRGSAKPIPKPMPKGKSSSGTPPQVSPPPVQPPAAPPPPSKDSKEGGKRR